MNQIRQIQALNKRELESCVSPNASWHADYRHTAYIYIGGLPFTLSEGDLVTIFSQFGEPTFIKLARDKETGKSKGFGWLKYEDQRSCDLAVDNLGGTEVLGRLLRVDHAEYKKRDNEEEDGGIDLTKIEAGYADGNREDDQGERNGRRNGRHEQGDEKDQRPVLKEERELEKLLRDHDDDDPMKEFLIQEKQKEVNEALKRWKKGNKSHKRVKDREDRSHRHTHRHASSRPRRESGDKEQRHRNYKPRSALSKEDNFRDLTQRRRRSSSDESLGSRNSYEYREKDRRKHAARLDSVSRSRSPYRHRSRSPYRSRRRSHSESWSR